MMQIAALMLGSHLVFVADGPPKFDPQIGCASAAASALVAGRKPADCVAEEERAHDVLTKSWGEFSAADKSHCGAMVRTGGQPSYVELLSCLEMSRDARQLATQRAGKGRGSGRP